MLYSLWDEISVNTFKYVFIHKSGRLQDVAHYRSFDTRLCHIVKNLPAKLSTV